MDFVALPLLAPYVGLGSLMYELVYAKVRLWKYSVKNVSNVGNYL